MLAYIIISVTLVIAAYMLGKHSTEIRRLKKIHEFEIEHLNKISNLAEKFNSEELKKVKRLKSVSFIDGDVIVEFFED